MHPFARAYVRNLPRALLLTAVLVASMLTTYVLTNRERFFLSPTSVVIYGRESCGFTAALRRRLAKENIPFDYADIDVWPVNFEVAGYLHMWTKPRAVRLPIVLYDGKVVERPTNDEVVEAYLRLTRPSPPVPSSVSSP